MGRRGKGALWGGERDGGGAAEREMCMGEGRERRKEIGRIGILKYEGDMRWLWYVWMR